MRKFTALYTHQKLKKAKTWQDGSAHYYADARELVLFAAGSERIASYRLRAKESIELACEYDVGRFLLTLEAEETGAEAQPAVAPKDAGQPDCAGGAPRAVRRIKRPASLIKPIKLKSAPPADAPPADAPPADAPPATDSPLPAARATDGDSGCVEYTVLYTTQKAKKAKTWSDGELAFSPGDRRLTLKDEGGATLTSTHVPGSVTVAVGSEIDSGRFLIQIECVKGYGSAGPATSGLEPRGALRRRQGALRGGQTLPGPGLAAGAQGRPGLVRLSKRPSSLVASDASESGAEPAPHAAQQAAQPGPQPPKRAHFAPPAPQTPTHLHFPRRGELLQHVGVSKGYGLGPPRRLVAPATYGEWTEYRDGLAALLRENLAVELSALAIRYFFMARERLEGRDSEPPARTQSARRRGRAPGAATGLAQVCKSVGVLLFDGCTLRQPFLDSAAFKAQRSTGSVQLGKGDSVMLELSRREAYAGYAKDDTWALSTSEDFAYSSTFLARSAFYGPSKNNTLELVLVGDEDARAAARIFSDSGCSTAAPAIRSARAERPAPTVYAIRCLDSASAWSMLDTIEELLSPETLPILPRLLGMVGGPPAPDSAPAASMAIDSAIDGAAVLAKVDDIVATCKQSLDLNEEQHHILRQVVMSAVSIYIPVGAASPITVIHGPFGTGKSFLIAAITACLDEIAHELPEVFGGPTHGATGPESPHAPPRLRVMLSSMTNFAVDNMLGALLKQGYDQFLRVGSLKRVSRKILPYVLRSSASAADDVKELQSMLELADDDVEAGVIGAAIQRIRHQDTQSTLDDTFVVGTTCLSAAATTLRGTRFPVVILDEACQIVEPMALIALANAGCQRLVLVGDPLQLPPTLTTRATREAEGRGLDRALFDRLVQMGHAPRFLSRQYRCHPRIASLCNRLFYEGRLLHGIGPEARPPLVPGVPPLAFLETAGQEKQHGKSQSFFNKGEIDMAVQLACCLLEAGVQPESVGVIALYKTQADMLQERLGAALGQRSRVQVSTVDAYQGSERDIIIISCVRTDKIGFIANPNRINVALSRARNHCLILGSRRLLETNGMWRAIIDYCRADAAGAGVMPAQALSNRIAAAAVGGRNDPDCVPAAAWQQDTEEAGGARKEGGGMAGTEMADTEMAGSEAEDAEAADADGGDGADGAGSPGHISDGCAAWDPMEPYFDDAVVGGVLSQWSLAGIGGEGSDGESPDDDVLGHLDVDLDEM